MASEWEIKTIAECSAPDAYSTQMGPFGKALMASEYVETGVPVLRGTNVNHGRFHDDDYVFIDAAAADRLTKYESFPGDVLLVHKGTLGKIGLMPRKRKYGRYIMGNSMMRVNCDRHKLLPEYLYYWLTSEAGQHYLFSRVSQVGVPQIQTPLSTLRQASLPVPPLHEQKAITEALGALDDKIELLDEAVESLSKIARAIFKSWFVDFDPIRAKAEGQEPEGMDAATAALFPNRFGSLNLRSLPDGWTEATLGSITQKITKGTTPTTFNRSFIKEGINFIKVESISSEGFLLPSKYAFIDSATHGLLQRSQLEPSDILITIAGTIGRLAHITADQIPANTNQAVAIIRPNEKVAPMSFLKQYLTLETTQQKLREHTVEAVQANVSLSTLSALRVVLPPPIVLARLCEAIFAPIDNRIDENVQMTRTLADLRDILLPRLISGKLRVPEAEKLLESVL